MTALADGTALYRIWGDGGLLLYVGISDDFGGRWKAACQGTAMVERDAPPDSR